MEPLSLLPPLLAGFAGFLAGCAALGVFGARGRAAALLEPRRAGLLRRLLEPSKDRRAKLARMLEAAGERMLTPEAAHRQSLVYAAGGAALGALASVALGDALGIPGPLLAPAAAPFCALLGYQNIESRLRERAGRRVKLAVRDAADFVEMLGVLNEAGLGLVQAAERLAQEWPGSLGEEFRRAAAEGRGGRWAAAVEEIPLRLNHHEIHYLCASLAQAERTGAASARQLLEIGRALRRQRAARAKERAGRVAVKMLAPILVCFFVPILALLVVPAGTVAMRGIAGM